MMGVHLDKGTIRLKSSHVFLFTYFNVAPGTFKMACVSLIVFLPDSAGLEQSPRL